MRDAGSRKHLKTGRRKTMSRGPGFYSGSPPERPSWWTEGTGDGRHSGLSPPLQCNEALAPGDHAAPQDRRGWAADPACCTCSRAPASPPRVPTLLSGPRCCASTTGQPTPAPSPTGLSLSACWPSSARTSGLRASSSCTTCVPTRGAGGTLAGGSAPPWVSGLLPAQEAGGYGRAGRQSGDSGSSKARREGTSPPVLRLAQVPEPHLPPGS